MNDNNDDESIMLGRLKNYATIEFMEGERHNWLAYRCNYETCIWVAQDDGIYLVNVPMNLREFPTPIAIEEELRRQFSINPRLIAFLLPLRALVFFERGSSPSLRILLLSRLFRRQSVQAPRFPSSHSIWALCRFNFEMISSYIIPYLLEGCHFSEGFGRF
ncbi:unnamed protein product [Citrullus colocynthis]|uniref:Uncharacterized protein n=1 Tax=Citrullus colocynthis TaxID=252529 RepID=A0ABP0YKV6_9ROSI